MSEGDLLALGRECAEIESHVGITGMLVHRAGNLLQVIEGSNCVVRDMYARFWTDSRNENIGMISDRTIHRREFDGLAVGFRNLDVLPKNTPFLNPFDYETFQADPELAMLVLAYFFRNPCEEATRAEFFATAAASLL